ncbi:MAG: hypothetical protein J6C41_05290 [Oscillospiraceae bacterium]|nr:hypothetical protein [Oscillospiraceae bacterium]
MARTTYVFSYTDAAATEASIKKILTEEKYELVFEKGEHVWKCGNGVFTSIKYIKYEFIDQSTLHITGWVRSDLGGEFSLDGYLVGYHKKKVREVINRIKAVIR